MDSHAQPERRVQAVEEATIERAEGHLRLDRRGAPARWHRETIAETRLRPEGVAGAIGRLNRVTDAAPPNYAAPPPGPNPVALAIAYDLVTRYRLRLADQRDGRLGELLGHYVLAAAMWNGPGPRWSGSTTRRRIRPRPVPIWPRAAMPPRRWGLTASRSRVRRCATSSWSRSDPWRGRCPRPPPGRPGAARRRVGRHGQRERGHGAADPAWDAARRRAARARTSGARRGPDPTLAAVDLAERQAVAGGYVAPVRRAMVRSRTSRTR